ncbi:MAG: hypothetical protein J2P27_06795 [Actinobacteria bacterium]|nr:hypothetical protein [Actinomycetota bacterium]
MRGLLGSPWFAAGAGIVIAAGAVVYSPHSRLHLKPAITVTHCKVAGCNNATSKSGSSPQVAGVGTEPVIAGPGQSAATAGLTFSYDVVWRSATGFGMVITVHGQHDLGSWRLAFVIPGASNLEVQGAHWRPAGPDGGTASGSTSAGQPALTSPDPFVERSRMSGADPDTAQFFVDGSGTARPPTGCVYNGASCHLVAS